MSKKLDLTLSIGKKLVGSYSRPNKFITWYCNKYNKPSSWLTAPWCAMFASNVLSSAGVKASGNHAYCPSWVAKFKADKKWGTTPRVGAVAFFDWNGDKIADHVGIVTDVGSNVRVLEGNTTVGGARNRVAVQTRSKSTIMGYGYPDYGEAPSVKTYVTKKGDTLSKIGKLYGVDWKTLYAKNKATVGKDPDRLAVGIRLVIP